MPTGLTEADFPNRARPVSFTRVFDMTNYRPLIFASLRYAVVAIAATVLFWLQLGGK